MAAVLSLDAADSTGEHAAHGSFASNGEIHKIRLSPEGQRIGLGEYIPPQRYGFMLQRPREVSTCPKKSFSFVCGSVHGVLLLSLEETCIALSSCRYVGSAAGCACLSFLRCW